MNILIDELAEKVDIDGEEIEINTDFRNVLLYFRALKDDELEEAEKLEIAVRLFFKTMPKDIEKAIKYINEEYIVCLNRKKIKGCVRVKDPVVKEPKEKAVFDFEQDGTLIYVSFMQEYGIDLRKEKLHWYVFKALFDGLGEGTALRRVIEFRRMKPKDMPRERRLELLELQKELEVKDPKVRVKDPLYHNDGGSKAPLNYDDSEGTVYRRRAKEIEKELLEGLKNG